MLRSLFNNPSAYLQFLIKKEKVLSRIFGKKLDIQKTWIETPGKFDDMVDFLNWFNTTSSVEECMRLSERDWRFNFQASPHFTGVKKKNALEIGFGAGRMLLQAAKDFEHVTGVDIHASFPMTERFLLENGPAGILDKITLLHRDQVQALKPGSMDFVFSFIVFQHFSTIEEVDFYLDLIHRVLTPEGYAHIYFGKNKGEGVAATKGEDFVLRDCSLFINLESMKKFVSKKFDLLDSKDNLYRDPEKQTGESVQAYVAIRKK